MTPSEELLSAYLDDELGAHERTQVERRLASDPQWRETLDKLQEVRSWMQDLPAVTPSCPKPILQMLAEQKPDNQEQTVQLQHASSRSHTHDSWKWGLSLATAATLLLGTTLWWMSGTNREMALAPNSRGAIQNPATQRLDDSVGTAATMSSMVASGKAAAKESQVLETSERAAENGVAENGFASGAIPEGTLPAGQPLAMLQEKENSLPDIPATSATVGDSNTLQVSEAHENLGNLGAGSGGFPGGSMRSARGNSQASARALSNELPTVETITTPLVAVEKFYTEDVSSTEDTDYVVLQTTGDSEEQKPVAAEGPWKNAVSSLQLIIPAEALGDLEEAIKSGYLGLKASTAVSVASSAKDDTDTAADDLKANSLKIENKRWLIELSPANYEALRTRWSEKGFDVTEILDAPEIMVLRRTMKDKADEHKVDRVEPRQQAISSKQTAGSKTDGDATTSTPPTNFIFILLQRR